jgi:hypothetical protein
MNGRFFLATLAGTVVAFFLGWLIFGILLMGFYETNTTHYEGLMKQMPDMLPIILANLSMAFFLAFVFQRWANTRTFVKGFGNGIFITFLWILGFDLFFLASMNLYPLSVVVVDIIANTLLGGIVGGVVAWVLGYKNRAATS